LTQGQANQHLLNDLSASYGSDFLFALENDFRICHGIMDGCVVVSLYETEDTNAVKVRQTIRAIPSETLTEEENTGG
jgi:hypothetical protein